MTSVGERHDLRPEDSFTVDRDYFVDAGIWRRELKNVFHRSWQFVGHESELPEPGDYITRKMGVDEVIVARSESGEISVMLNSCTHRGTLLCKADVGNSANFRCGYHGWTFKNDGTLSGVPRGRELYGKSFDKSKLGLVRARVTSFYGLIFATFDHELCSFEDYVGDMSFYLQCLLDVSAAGTEAHNGAFRFTHLGNWKLEADNFAGDGYHLRHAHRAGFDLGLMGAQARPTEGVCIQFEHGHALRAQRSATGEEGVRFPGYPAERWAEIESRLSPDQAQMFSDSSVVHGLIFPNFAFIHTPRAGGLDPGEQDAASLQVRLNIPLSPSVTEMTMWHIAPRDYAPEWKHSAYKTMQRQHGATAFFESDDHENFRRMAQVNLGAETRDRVPSRFDLARDIEPFEPWFTGPGQIVGSDISEVNQRWFYTHYLSLLQGSE